MYIVGTCAQLRRIFMLHAKMLATRGNHHVCWLCDVDGNLAEAQASDSDSVVQTLLQHCCQWFFTGYSLVTVTRGCSMHGSLVHLIKKITRSVASVQQLSETLIITSCWLFKCIILGCDSGFDAGLWRLDWWLMVVYIPGCDCLNTIRQYKNFRMFQGPHIVSHKPWREVWGRLWQTNPLFLLFWTILDNWAWI